MKTIILAGGSGSRLWPLSRDLYPKQLLTLDEKESLLQKTYKRTMLFSAPSDIAIVTNIKHYSNIKLQLNKINKTNIVIAEPLLKNTAPAIACTLEYFKQKSTMDDVVLIVPSDHLITQNDKFAQTIKQGEILAQMGYIVTFGIKPTYPETGYGYVKTQEKISCGMKVDRFVEKPNLDLAKEYIKSGNYYWNSGIFMGKISVLLEEFKNFAPDIYENLTKLDFSEETKINYEIYEKMPSISIDYAIMEKSKKIVLVEFNSDWNDLGSWQSIYAIKPKDSNGNVIIGNVITNNVKNSFIYSQKELIAVSDLEDVILIGTEDAVMACKMVDSQNVKKLYEKLKERESDTTKIHKTVFRPWGYYTCLNAGKGYLTKLICVLPHQKLSLQSHSHRSEHWVVLEGTALVIKDDSTHNVYSGDSIDIPLGIKHSLQNPYDKELKILEVQKGDYISEDDIVRYEDSYGRI